MQSKILFACLSFFALHFEHKADVTLGLSFSEDLAGSEATNRILYLEIAVQKDFSHKSIVCLENASKVKTPTITLSLKLENNVKLFRSLILIHCSNLCSARCCLKVNFGYWTLASGFRFYGIYKNFFVKQVI